MAVLRYFTELRQREFAEGKHKPKRHPKPGVPVPVAGQKAGRGVRLLEGLAASGLRAIRYALEVRAWPSRVYIRLLSWLRPKQAGAARECRRNDISGRRLEMRPVHATCGGVWLPQGCDPFAMRWRCVLASTGLAWSGRAVRYGRAT